MLIQCQHCHTTYKINEDKIPDKEAFVRCAKCSEPIHLNQEKQPEISRRPSHKTVECEKCNSRYSVPFDTIKDDSTKVRCGKCGHYFSITKPVSDTELNDFEMDTDLNSDEYEVESVPLAEDDIDLDNISIPEESEIEVDSLFNGDEQEDDTTLSDENDIEKPPKNATEEYLESVDISLSDDDPEELEIDGISNDQKYKIFLKPNSNKQGSENADSWPEIQDDNDSLNLDDEMNQDVSEFTGLEELDEMPDFSPDKNQVTTPTKNKKRVFLWILWGLVIIAIIVILAGWIFESRIEKKRVPPPQEEVLNNVTELSILEPLNGRELFSKSNKIKIFVLEGKIANLYPPHIVINNIEIEGMLFDQKEEILTASKAFAGNKLTTTQLEQWSQNKIESSLSKPFKIESGKTFQFQIVFFDSPKNVHSLGAKIKRFNKSKN